MTDDVPSICLKRRNRLLAKLIGERPDLEDVCEEEDDYCAHCHSRISLP